MLSVAGTPLFNQVYVNQAAVKSASDIVLKSYEKLVGTVGRTWSVPTYILLILYQSGIAYLNRFKV